MVSDALLDYNADVLEVAEVQKDLETPSATLQGWSEDIYPYVPSAFSSGAAPG